MREMTLTNDNCMFVNILSFSVRKFPIEIQLVTGDMAHIELHYDLPKKDY